MNQSLEYEVLTNEDYLTRNQHEGEQGKAETEETTVDGE